MIAFLLLIVVGVVAVGVIAGFIVLMVRRTDSSQSEPYVPHAWQPVHPPGWYPDPSNPNLMRYFDGRQWTSATGERS